MYNRCVSRSAPRYTTMTHYSWSSRKEARTRIDRRTTRSRLFTDAKNFKRARSVSSSSTNNMRLDCNDSGLATLHRGKTRFISGSFTCNLSKCACKKFNYAIKISWNIFIQRSLPYHAVQSYFFSAIWLFLTRKINEILGHSCNQNFYETIDFINNKSRIPPCLFPVDRSIMVINLSLSLMRACVYVYNITVIGVVLLNMY